jgi:hypothetical protein
VVDKKEVRFGKIDQMSRAEIENRLKVLMGDVIEGELTDETEESISPSAVDLVKDDTAQKE